jgi:hypothetical protein
MVEARAGGASTRLAQFPALLLPFEDYGDVDRGRALIAVGAEHGRNLIAQLSWVKQRQALPSPGQMAK